MNISWPERELRGKSSATSDSRRALSLPVRIFARVLSPRVSYKNSNYHYTLDRNSTLGNSMETRLSVEIN